MDRAMRNGDSGTQHDGSGHHDSTSQHEDRTLTDVVREQPVACLAIAAAAGFVLGGGARRSGGLTILALMGQIAMREALGDLVTATLGNGHDA